MSMSFRRLLRGLKAGFGESDEQQDLRRFGLQVGVNWVQMARVDAIESNVQEINSALNSDRPVDALDKLSELISTVGIPFMRAPDTPPVAIALGLWLEMVGMVKAMWDALIAGEPDRSRSALAQSFRRFIERDILPAGYVMLSLCFRDKDITPNYINVIRSGEGGAPTSIITPTSVLASDKRGE